ncbi:glycoside hydrolase family 108 protein [Pseudovibrio sp. SPO723]|uniref:glycoside hydrolase family 108 protein n=1 Tax=Nesiotobacter zosterae TaxID=392721 RepID=UPI0029C52F93|nr:glycosyl hydrolase 108 family protein [Pseudovibrio sp. SPO723]MDX5592587.1 glycosyl hydrolase 108 family protein [Pseudovibrio sp. SPO723]
MKTNFQLVMGWVSLSEGGYVDDPADPGGATNHGITRQTLSEWRGHAVTKDAVRLLTKDEAEQIYKARYFDLVRFDELPAGLDYTLVDFAINSGPGRAIRFLQRALKVKEDGVFGPVTMTAVEHCLAMGNMPALIVSINEKRLAFMRSLRHWPRFKNGWTRRVMGDVMGSQRDDIGVIDRSIMLYNRHYGHRQEVPIPDPKPARGKAEGKASAKAQWLSQDGMSKIAAAAGTLGSAFAGQPILQYGLVAIALVGLGYLIYRQTQAEPAHA